MSCIFIPQKAGFHGRLACRLLGLQDKALYTPHGVTILRTDISRLKARYYAFLENIASHLGGRLMCDGATEAVSFRELGHSCRGISKTALHAIRSFIPHHPVK